MDDSSPDAAKQAVLERVRQAGYTYGHVQGMNPMGRRDAAGMRAQRARVEEKMRFDRVIQETARDRTVSPATVSAVAVAAKKEGFRAAEEERARASAATEADAVPTR